MHQEIIRRTNRWNAFFREDVDAPRHMFILRVPTNLGPRPYPLPGNIQDRIDYASRLYDYQMAQMEWLPDDMVPHLDPFTGTELFAEAFGCTVHYPDDNMPFAHSCITNPNEVDGLSIPDLGTPALERVFTIADTLCQRAGHEAVMRLPDTQSPLDIAALIWDKTEFYPAFVEAPDAIKLLISKTMTLFTNFFDAWFNRYGSSCIAHCPEYYLERGITLSEDEVGIISVDMFEEFALPSLVEISNRYGAIGIHCCADSIHQWSAFRTIPGVKLLNLRHLIAREAYAYFANHTAQMHGCLTSQKECDVL